jgi:hypothetical protein
VYMKQWPEEKGGGEREMSRWVWTPGEFALCACHVSECVLIASLVRRLMSV